MSAISALNGEQGNAVHGLCIDHNWFRCSADGEADNPVNEKLSKLLEEYFYKGKN